MYGRIMVPLDESHVAEQAIGVGARLARAADGTLVLVEVVRGLAEFESGIVPPVNWAPAAVERERKAAQNYVHGISQREELAGIPVEIATYAGAVAPTLLMACREQRVDAVVMTTHGRTGLARWALGGVAHHLVQQAPVPLLLLREGGLALTHEPIASEPLYALVALDGSPLAETALLPAVRVVAALSRSPEHAELGAVHLVRVVDALDLVRGSYQHDSDLAPFEQALSRALEASRTYLKGVAEHLQHGEAGRLGVTVTWSVVCDQAARSFDVDVAEAILRVASAGEPVEGMSAPDRCQLIGMATHGRGAFSRWALGSIADRVLHAGSLPMLLVGPRVEPDHV